MGGWREPTSRLPLRWGTYRGRYLAGLLLITGGILHLQSSTTHLLLPLLVGTTAHVIGWWILPGRGVPRLMVVLPCCVAQWLLLTGPQSTWVLAVPFLAWLWVRGRPPLSVPTVLIVVLTGVAVAQGLHEYSSMWIAISITGASLVVAAWAARWIAVRVPVRLRRTRRDRRHDRANPQRRTID